jgi:hypothetical protein
MKKKSKDVMLGFGAVAVIGILAVLVLSALGVVKLTPQAAVGNNNVPPPAAVAGGYYTTPTIAVSAYDAKSTGTAVSNILTYQFGGVGGFGSTPTTATPGQSLELLVTNGTTYHTAYVPSFVVAVSSFPKAVAMNRNGSISENLYTTTGVVLQNGVGGQNQTVLGAGITYNIKDEMIPGAYVNTQDMTCVIELTAGVNASAANSVLFDGQMPKATGAPSWYTLAGVNSRVWLFDIPALSGTMQTHYLSLTPDASKVFSALSYLKKSCYTKEHFIDPNTGLHTFDVADSNGALKAIAHYDYTAYFQ